MVSMADVCSI